VCDPSRVPTPIVYVKFSFFLHTQPYNSMRMRVRTTTRRTRYPLWHRVGGPSLRAYGFRFSLSLYDYVREYKHKGHRMGTGSGELAVVSGGAKC